MRIAHLISQYLPTLGGAQICVHNISKELTQMGDEVVVITTTQDKRSMDYGYRIIRISQWFLKLLKYPSIGQLFLDVKLWSLQQQYKFDLWQVTVGYPLGAHAVQFFKKNNIPCLLRCCGEDIQIDRELSYGYRLSSSVDNIIRKTYPKYSGFVALTESVRKEYLRLGIPDEKIRIVPNGVSLSRFEMLESKASAKKRLALKSKKVLLTVGRNHPKKGFNLIPLILQKVYEFYKDFLWIIIGKDCNRESFPELKDGLGDALFFIDELNSKNIEQENDLPSKELIDYYLCADIFVLPSYIETFGMVLIEANAANLPVVTSDVPGCRDVIKDKYNGFLCKAGDIEMFADRIVNLLVDEKLHSNICNNIKGFVGSYDWPVVVDSYRSYYIDLLKA